MTEKPGSKDAGAVESDLGSAVNVAGMQDATNDPVYAAKTRVLNEAIQEIGMGRYQWLLFALVGFGFSADNWLPILTSLIFTPVVNEFNPSRGPYLQLGQNLGLLVGAAFWGFGSDIIGRKPAFNCTFALIGVFALLAGSSPSFFGVCAYAFLWSLGVGGNLPVDTSLFLEYLPGSHQFLLVLLSIWWSAAQVIITALAWWLLGNYTCSQQVAAAGQCTRDNNMGWRYLSFLSGGLYVVLWLLRFLFPLRESPKYLMGKGRDAEAVDVVKWVAKFNGKTSTLELHDLQGIDEEYGTFAKTGELDAAKRSLARFNVSHLTGLFETRKVAISTTLLCLIWLLIGLAFPLYNSFIPYYLASRGAEAGDGSTSITYRNSMIIAVVGIPAVLLGSLLVQIPRLGRRGALALSTVLTGVFIMLSTTARTSNALLGWNVAYNFCSTIMYSCVYALTPEIFPTRHRGTGNGLTASCNRIAGVMAPIVAIFADLTTSAPIFVAGVLFLVAGLASVLLPFETRGRMSM